MFATIFWRAVLPTLPRLRRGPSQMQGLAKARSAKAGCHRQGMCGAHARGHEERKPRLRNLGSLQFADLIIENVAPHAILVFGIHLRDGGSGLGQFGLVEFHHRTQALAESRLGQLQR